MAQAPRTCHSLGRVAHAFECFSCAPIIMWGAPSFAGFAKGGNHKSQSKVFTPRDSRTKSFPILHSRG